MDERGETKAARGGRGRAWIAVLRAVLGLAVLVVVFSRLDVGDVARVLGQLSWAPLLLAGAAQLAAKLVWTSRWREILRATGLERGFGELLALVFIGLFFNTFLPTGMGGDLVRGYYTARGREGLASAYAAVIVERALGLIALAGLACTASVVALLLGGSSYPARFLIATGAIGGLATVVGTLAFASSRWSMWITRQRVHPMLEAVCGALRLFQRPAIRRGWIVLCSLALQVIAVLFHVACARSVGLDAPTILFFLIVPASVLAAMVPITLNGLGLREGALVGLLVAAGQPAEPAAAFALLALAVSMAFALAGGLVYPFYRTSSMEAAGVSADS